MAIQTPVQNNNAIILNSFGIPTINSCAPPPIEGNSWIQTPSPPTAFNSVNVAQITQGENIQEGIVKGPNLDNNNISAQEKEALIDGPPPEFPNILNGPANEIETEIITPPITYKPSPRRSSRLKEKYKNKKVTFGPIKKEQKEFKH